MGSRRRGSQLGYEWTDLFHRIASSVSKDVVQEITKTAVEYVGKNISGDKEKNVNATVSSQTKSVRDDKVKNEENDTDDSYIYETESECSITSQSDADNILNETGADNGSPFVLLDTENRDLEKPNLLQSISAMIKGLPSEITEDQVLIELAKHYFSLIAVRKITPEKSSQHTDPLFLVRAPAFVESQLMKIDKLLSYEVHIQKQGPEHKTFECTKLGHDTTNCDILTDQITKQTCETNCSGSTSTTDLGYTSVNSNNYSQTSSASISKVDIFSSSRNSTPDSSNSKVDCNDSLDIVSKQPLIKDTIKLIKELKEIKKEVESIKLEIKINMAKKFDSDFIHIALQGIPPEVKTQDIVNDLKSKHFSVDAVYRLRNEDGEVTDEVVFELPKKEDHIFYYSCCLGFEVRVEKYKDDFSWVKKSLVLSDALVGDASSNKPINVLFRGIPKEVDASDILRDLREKYFHPIAIYGMEPSRRHLQENSKYIFLVQVPPEEDHIHELSCVLGFSVTIEDVDKGTLNVSQCKTCLQFGHKTIMCSKRETPKMKNSSTECKILYDAPTVNAVIKGIPIEFNDNLVLNDLVKNGFNPIAIHRMVVSEEILPSYLVQVPEHEKRISLLTCCLGFSVKVEEFIPSMYDVAQCEKCRQFGHSGNSCMEKEQMEPQEIPIKSTDSEQNVDAKERIHEDAVNTKISDNESQDNQKASIVSNFVKVESTSTQTGCLDEYADKFDNLEGALKIFITQNNEKLYKSCCCREVSTCDASTTTDSTREQLEEMNQAINFYQEEFLKRAGVFAEAVAETNITLGKIGDLVNAYLTVNEMSGLMATFVESMIRILTSSSTLMLSFGDLPGVTINTINEQLHLLEELEDTKRTMNRAPGIFTTEYYANFPKLE